MASRNARIRSPVRVHDRCSQNETPRAGMRWGPAAYQRKRQHLRELLGRSAAKCTGAKSWRRGRAIALKTARYP